MLGENARAGVHTEVLFAWGEREPLIEPSPFRIVACGLSVLGATAVVALIAFLLAQSGILELREKTRAGLQLYFLSIGIVYTTIQLRFKKRMDRIMKEIDAAGYELNLIAGVIGRLEAERFTSPYLVRLRSELDTKGWPPSRQIAKLNRLIQLIDSRRNLVVQVIGPLLLWDLHLSYPIRSNVGAKSRDRLCVPG